MQKNCHGRNCDRCLPICIQMYSDKAPSARAMRTRRGLSILEESCRYGQKRRHHDTMYREDLCQAGISTEESRECECCSDNRAPKRHRQWPQSVGGRRREESGCRHDNGKMGHAFHGAECEHN